MNQAAGKNSVAMDIGTTYSSVAFVDLRVGGTSRERPYPVPISVQARKGEADQYCLHSRVFFNQDGQVYVGELNPEPDKGAIALEEFKLEIGQNKAYPWLEDKDATPEDAAIAVIRFLKKKAEDKLGERVDSVHLSIPPHIRGREADKTQLMMELAERTGLHAHVLEEPIAALCYVDFVGEAFLGSEDRCVMVVDYGGGTCDVALMVVSQPRVLRGKKRQLLGLSSSRCGGRLIDQRIADWVQARCPESVEGLSRNDLVRAARHTKEQMSNCLRTMGPRDGVHVLPGRRGPLLSREIFENMVQPEVERILDPMEDAIIQSAMRNDGQTVEIDDVFLVGGSSNLPMVAPTVQNFLKDHLTSADCGRHREVHLTKMPATHSMSAAPEHGDTKHAPSSANRDPRLAVSCGAALHRYYRNLNQYPIHGYLDTNLWMEVVGGTPELLLSAGREVPARKPHSRLVRMVQSDSEVVLKLCCGESNKLQDLTQYAEPVFEFDRELPEGTIMRVETMLTERARAEIRVYPRKEKHKAVTKIIPRPVGD